MAKRKVDFSIPTGPDFRCLELTSFGLTAATVARKVGKGYNVNKVRYRIGLTEGAVSAKHWREGKLPEQDRTMRKLERRLNHCDRIIRDIRRLGLIHTKRG